MTAATKKIIRFQEVNSSSFSTWLLASVVSFYIEMLIRQTIAKMCIYSILTSLAERSY